MGTRPCYLQISPHNCPRFVCTELTVPKSELIQLSAFDLVAQKQCPDVLYRCRYFCTEASKAFVNAAEWCKCCKCVQLKALRLDNKKLAYRRHCLKVQIILKRCSKLCNCFHKLAQNDAAVCLAKPVKSGIMLLYTLADYFFFLRGVAFKLSDLTPYAANNCRHRKGQSRLHSQCFAEQHKPRTGALRYTSKHSCGEQFQRAALQSNATNNAGMDYTLAGTDSFARGLPAEAPLHMAAWAVLLVFQEAGDARLRSLPQAEPTLTPVSW